MRRVLAVVIVVVAVGGFTLLTGAAADDGSDGKRYWIQLDNAFGLTEGSDFKIAGVRAGRIGEMKVDLRSKKALVAFEITVPTAPALKTDVTCETRPQSLIGEYFIDCNAGRAPTELRAGATIPVTHTFSTIPADLVNNILRLPQRERLRVVLNELGIGLAARGGDANQVIRRAVPALRETDRLLDILADENRTLVNLTTNADAAVGELTRGRKQISRFAREARDTSAATADRRVALRQTFRRLPSFLRELRLNLNDLGRVADSQIPTLHDLDAASGNLKAFLEALEPFSDASQPSLASLGETSVVGRDALPPIQDTVDELETFADDIPELGKNLRIVLEDLYDRDRAVEKDPTSPGGRGFNGYEALLRYVFAQSQAINIFDRNGYILKVAVYDEGAVTPNENDDCSPYYGAESVRGNEELQRNCASALGPTQPGINAPDPSSRNRDQKAETKALARAADAARVLQGARRSAGPPPSSGLRGGPPPPGRADGGPIDILGSLRRFIGRPEAEPTPVPAPVDDRHSEELLLYLFGP